ncbi:hypothetical protein BSN85_16365 [Bradyrhizobium brasilense]|nr:hypothetical protein BSN85_16365 [Bradyrhizobium brasilense]
MSGLLVREEPSAAIMRCGTAAEIAANIAIRSAFDEESEFNAKTVDSFLIWANGLKGKMDHLVLPVCFNGNSKNATYKKLSAWARTVNDARNDVAHRGSFASKNKADEIIAAAKLFITTLVPLYEPDFELKEK